MIMNKIIDKIMECNKIAITFHTSPDGDALGSSLALLQGLMKLKKEVYIISTDKVPDDYSFLPYKEIIENASTQVLSETECVIVLDCGDYKRISWDNSSDNKEYTLINIDHHLSNELYADLNYADANAAAVGEIVYQILCLMNIKIDKDIATCLYTSLVTDSGGFRFSNTTSVTHTIAGDLINTGIDFSDIHRKIYENKKFNRVKLYGKVIENMYLIGDNQICVMELTENMLKDLGLEQSDTSDLLGFGTQIDTVEVTILLKENAEGVKISLRSKSEVDVRRIAEKFGGGGHTRAAGLFLRMPLCEAKKTIIKAVEEMMM